MSANLYDKSTYAGDLYSKVVSEIVTGNEFVEKGLVQIEENIKHQRTVRSLSGEITVQEYTSGVPTTKQDIRFHEAVLTPKLFTISDEFDPTKLRTTWFSETILAGAKNVESNEAKSLYVAFLIKKAQERIGKMYGRGITQGTKNWIADAANASKTTAKEKAWAASAPVDFIDGIVANMIVSFDLDGNRQAVDVINVEGADLTVTNLGDEMAKFYQAIPYELLSVPGLKIVACHKLKSLINTFNKKQQYRDVFNVNGESYSYNGITIEFANLPDNVMFTGVSEELFMGTDLTADAAEFIVALLHPMGKTYGVRGDMSLCAGVANPGQKVLYIG